MSDPSRNEIRAKPRSASNVTRKPPNHQITKGTFRYLGYTFQGIGAIAVALFAFWKTLPQDTQKHAIEDLYFWLQPKADIKIEPMRVAESCKTVEKANEISGHIATYVTEVTTRNAIRYLETKGFQVYSSWAAQGLDRLPARYSLELTMTCLPRLSKTTNDSEQEALNRSSEDLFGGSLFVDMELTSKSMVISSVRIPLGLPLLTSKVYDRKFGINSDAVMAAVFETMALPSDLSMKLNVPAESKAAAGKYGTSELMQYRAAESVFAGGDKDLATDILTNAVSASPAFAIGYSALAEIKRSQGAEAEAEAFERKALEIDKDYPRIPFVTKILNPSPNVKKKIAESVPTKIAEGASVLELEISSPPARFYVFSFDPKLFKFSIGLPPTTLGQTARQFRIDNAGVFSIVGGTFNVDPEGNLAPDALLVRRGVVMSPRNTEWDTGGFLLIGSGLPAIIPVAEFSRNKFEQSEDLLQSSLLVVDPGGRNGIRGRTPELADRAAICVQINGDIAFVIAKGLFQLAEFADLLAETKSRGGLGCERAMYLDGGPSAQASLALGSKNIELEGQWVVPNAVIVHRRTP